MGRSVSTFALACLTLAAACGGSGSDGATFIALDRDFAGFQSWYSVSPLPFNQLSATVDPTGTHAGFVSRRPPAGATRYPVGTVVVKAIEPSDDATTWELFGMAKRGGGFNASGAADWEYFLLRVGTDGDPFITSRGLAPSNDGSDMGADAYAPGGAAGGCNLCHGDSAYAGSDHVISPPLWPSATAQ
jgi:hypothetical protein